MKKIVTIATVIGIMLGCKDESLSPYLPPESNVTGYGQFVSPADGSLIPPDNDFYDQGAVDADVFFTGTNAASEVNLKLQWISVKKDVNITNIELYMEWDEMYTDDDRNQLIATHGVGPAKPTIPNGRLWKTIPAGSASRTPIDIKVTYDDVYQLFKGERFDYGTGEVDVFGTGNVYTGNTNRTSQRFHASRAATISGKAVTLAGDTFVVSWRFIADDGRAFGSWYDSICAESLGYNCRGQWTTK